VHTAAGTDNNVYQRVPKERENSLPDFTVSGGDWDHRLADKTVAVLIAADFT